MTDLIDRQEAIEILASAYGFFEDMDIDDARYAAERVFADVPTAERRGHWDMSKGIAICTVCGKAPSEFYIDGSEKWRYCPNCGAILEE